MNAVEVAKAGEVGLDGGVNVGIELWALMLGAADEQALNPFFFAKVPPTPPPIAARTIPILLMGCLILLHRFIPRLRPFRFSDRYRRSHGPLLRREFSITNFCDPTILIRIWFSLDTFWSYWTPGWSRGPRYVHAKPTTGRVSTGSYEYA